MTANHLPNRIGSPEEIVNIHAVPTCFNDFHLNECRHVETPWEPHRTGKPPKGTKPNFHTTLKAVSLTKIQHPARFPLGAWQTSLRHLLNLDAELQLAKKSLSESIG